MGKNKDVTPRKQAQIKILLQENMTGREIANKVKVSESVVSRMKHKLANGECLTPKKKKNSGRKRVTTTKDDRFLIREVKKNRRITSNNLMVRLHESGVSVSARTIRRRLCEGGLPARRPRKKQKLTAAMAIKRKLWAENYIEWTEKDWDKVICKVSQKIILPLTIMLFTVQIYKLKKSYTFQ